jgi:probable HAF family extracellular repeat protein
LNNCAVDDPRLAVVSTSWVNDQGEYGKTDSVRGMVWRPNVANNEFTVLGTLGSGTSNAIDVNIAGDVVGYSDTRRDGQHAFIFSNGGMTDLNAISPAGSRTLRQAWAINDDGEITGFMRIPKPVSEQRAFLLRRLP